MKRDRLEKKRGGETKEVAIREVAVRKKSSIEPCEPAVSVADRRLVGILLCHVSLLFLCATTVFINWIWMKKIKRKIR